MFDLGHLLEAVCGRPGPAGMQEISTVVVDSRRAIPGSLFVAFKGDRVDGHDYVEDAFRQGAIAALVEHPVLPDRVMNAQQMAENDNLAKIDLPVCILVDSTLLALQDLAQHWRERYFPRVIGITGSVGKTTSKELIHAVLRTRFNTLKNEGNLNNEIGLPLTLLQLNNEHERVVLEMGMYIGGEITTLAKIAQPQVGVITNVGPVHLERLGTMQAIADAKAELVEALPPGPEGVAILNHDEPMVRAMADRTEADVFTYGLSAQADLWADDIVGAGLDGIRFSLHCQGESVHIRAPLLGRHSVHTALRATAVALVEGMGWEDIVNGLQGDSPQLRLVAVNGPNGSLLLDDTYNASPSSTFAALNLLADLPTAKKGGGAGRRVAVLGDMLELGDYELTGHKLVGRRVIEVADYLITIGELGRIIAQESLEAGMSPGRVIILPNVQAAMETLPSFIQEGDMVLIKGSRGVRLDRLVDSLTHSELDTESVN